MNYIAVIHRSKTDIKTLLEFCKKYSIELQTIGNDHTVNWNGCYIPFNSDMSLVVFSDNGFVVMNEKDFRSFYSEDKPITTTTPIEKIGIEASIHENGSKLACLLLLQVLTILFLFLKTILR